MTAMMDITEFPEEVFIEIVKYLTPEDLYSCSLVNSTWRDAVNTDVIWRNICNNCTLSELGKDLNDLPRVLPLEPYRESSLLELCEWRKRYMKWDRLRDNWKKGRYKKYEINNVLNDSCEYDYNCDNTFIIVNDNLREVSVWDIRDTPELKERIRLPLRHVCPAFVKICNNVIVVVQCTLLTVYLSTDNNYLDVLFRRIFDREESLLLPTCEDLTSWYIENFNLYPCELNIECDQNGQFFVGAVLNSDYRKSVLHVWCLIERTSKETLQIPESDDVIVNIQLCLKGGLLYLMITNQGYHNCYETLYMYNLKKCKFLELKLNFNYTIPVYMFTENIVVTTDNDRKSLKITKIDTKNNKFFTSCIELEDFILTVGCFRIIDKNVLVGGRSLSNTNSKQNVHKICVYDLPKLKCMYKTKTMLYLDFLYLIHNIFLIIGGFEMCRVLEVHDINKDVFLYRITTDLYGLYANKSCTKLITKSEDDLIVLSFW